ncbi:MAG TPA: hypothetical protein VMU34_21780 [Mycobacterium sp.]|nr:hypothetical protein [Mycobacterium sp.]
MQSPQLYRLFFGLTDLADSLATAITARPTGNVNRQLVSPVESTVMREASPAARACNYGTQTTLGIQGEALTGYERLRESPADGVFTLIS